MIRLASTQIIGRKVLMLGELLGELLGENSGTRRRFFICQPCPWSVVPSFIQPLKIKNDGRTDGRMADAIISDYHATEYCQTSII